MTVTCISNLDKHPSYKKRLGVFIQTPRRFTLNVLTFLKSLMTASDYYRITLVYPSLRGLAGEGSPAG